MYQVILSRQTERGDLEQVVIDQCEDPFHYRLKPELIAQLDPKWEHSPIPIHITYEEIANAT